MSLNLCAHTPLHSNLLSMKTIHVGSAAADHDIFATTMFQGTGSIQHHNARIMIVMDMLMMLMVMIMTLFFSLVVVV